MENNNYNPYINPSQGYDTDKTANQTIKKKRMFTGFSTMLCKTIAIALVFGLVAGTAGLSVLYFGGNTLGIFPEIEDAKENVEDSKIKEVVQTGNIQQTSTEGQTTVAVMDVSDIVENVMPCVVAIYNVSEVTYQNMWGQRYTEESESCGTGFIVEQDEEYIYIATNNHVVEGAEELTVEFSDATVVNAEIKGTVASKDLAVIKVALEDISSDTMSVIRVATLGDSNSLEVGESAIAIGNALGYGQSVTTGVISALGRSVTVSDNSSGNTIVCNNLIQTDAAINPGNSGGALLNVGGEVIGINSIKYSDTNVEGIGYAIPISDAMLIINKLISGEKIDETQSGYLGIYGRDCEYGVYIEEVISGSAAEKAGMKHGDIITMFDGYSISTMSQLQELLSYYPAGETVEFVILRSEDKEMTLSVTLGDASIIPK